MEGVTKDSITDGIMAGMVSIFDTTARPIYTFHIQLNSHYTICIIFIRRQKYNENGILRTLQR